MIFDPITDAIFGLWKALQRFADKHPVWYGFIWFTLFIVAYSSMFLSYNPGLSQFEYGVNIGAAAVWAVMSQFYRNSFLKVNPLYPVILVLAILLLCGIPVLFTLGYFLLIWFSIGVISQVIKRTPLD